MKKYFDPMYCGSETMYRISPFIKKLIVTKSIKDVCTERGMFWTVDVIVSHYLTKKKLWAEGFITCFFDVKKDGSCSFKMTDGNDRVLARQKIDYTDAKDSVKYYLVDDGTNLVLMFPSDY